MEHPIRKALGLKHFDLSAQRSAEIDDVLEAILPARPLRAGQLVETYLVAYAALASRHGGAELSLGPEAYSRAKENGMLDLLAETYPDLVVSVPHRGVRGCHPTMVIFDEAAEWKPDEIRSHGG